MDSKKLRKLKNHLSIYCPIYLIVLVFIILSISFYVELGKYK